MTRPDPTRLPGLILRNNSLQGYIPINISNVRSFRILDLSWNNLTGSFPRMIEPHNIPVSFPSSHPIWVSENVGLTLGDLIVNWKKCFQGLTIRNLDNYSLLDLSHNRIIGEIPPSLGNLKALKLLSISHNKISGHIPVSFGNLVNIESLDLSHNEISGSIPQSPVKLSQLTVLRISGR
ncbi:putative non-specific serine/threonine protein kinase [Helianthus anomalus]